MEKERESARQKKRERKGGGVVRRYLEKNRKRESEKGGGEIYICRQRVREMYILVYMNNLLNQQ